MKIHDKIYEMKTDKTLDEDISLYDGNTEGKDYMFINIMTNGIIFPRIVQLLQKFPPAEVYEIIQHRVPLEMLNIWKLDIRKGYPINRRGLQTEELESKLLKWCIEEKKKGKKLQYDEVLAEAKEIAKRCKRVPKIKLEKQWIAYFLKRNGKATKTQFQLAWESSVSLKVIVNCFYNLYNSCMENKEYSSIWTYDEISIDLRPGLTNSFDIIRNDLPPRIRINDFFLWKNGSSCFYFP